MGIERKIFVQDEVDVALVRLRTREIARAMGFGTVAQARISLAAGELARALSFAHTGQREIVITGTDTNGHVGIQVMCVAPTHFNSDNSNGNNVSVGLENQPQDENEAKVKHEIFNALNLIDDYLVEDQGYGGTRVTIKSWLS